MRRLVALLILASVAFAADAATPLDPKEHDALVIAALDYLNARVTLLEALAAKKAGNDQVEASAQQQQKFMTMLADLRKAHGAGDTCGWDFAQKAWSCGK